MYNLGEILAESFLIGIINGIKMLCTIVLNLIEQNPWTCIAIITFIAVSKIVRAIRYKW